MPTVQYIGSDPTWGPQQQVARRQQQLQTSVTLGLADGDPTVKDRDRDIAANPYQLRNRYSSNAAVSNAVQLWVRKRLNTSDLGLADATPSVKPPWQYDQPYRLWWRTSEVAAINANLRWREDRLTGNDLGITDADPTVKPIWQYDQPYSLWKRDPTASAISAVNQWLANRLSGIDLGTADQDTALRPYRQYPTRRITDYTPYIIHRPGTIPEPGEIVIPPEPEPPTPSVPGSGRPANARDLALRQARREQIRREDDEILFLQ